jgi:PKD repeat protein/GH25 family lysozyme M1 (1,4-beta-N-acetylmuramidase)
MLYPMQALAQVSPHGASSADSPQVRGPAVLGNTGLGPQLGAPTFDGHMAMPGSATREAILNRENPVQFQPPNYLAATTKPLGVDVSKWQGTIDWVAVKNQGGKVFAFIRASAGKNTTDTQFSTNAANAVGAGLLVGAYHFSYPQYFSAHDEAQKFLSVAASYIGRGFLPPTLDVEDDQAGASYPYQMGQLELSQWISDWCAEVKQYTGIQPMIYTTRYYARNYLKTSLSQFLYWVPTDLGSPDSDPGSLGIWSSWAFQQYILGDGSRGTCPGVSGPVDLDSFNGDTNALVALAQKGGSATQVTLSVYSKLDGTASSGVSMSLSPSDNNGINHLVTPSTTSSNYATYNLNQSVVVTAPQSLSSGAQFVDWEDGCLSKSTSNCTVAMNGHRGVTALYASTSSLPDLVVTTLTAPSTGTIGGQIAVSATATNQGTASAGAYRLGLYFSTDGTITTSDTFVSSCPMPALTPGSSQACGGSVSIPSSLSAGTYYFGAFADDQFAVNESSESNNATYTQIVLSPSCTAPSITTQPQSQTITFGQTATLTVGALGASLSYQWYVGASGDTSVPLSGANGSSYTTPALPSTTSFWVRVSNSCGSANSATATITVNSSPPGTITVNATLNGAPWSGPVNYRISGIASYTGSSVPYVYYPAPASGYTLSYESGGPADATIARVLPSAFQSLSGGGGITWTLQFTSTCTAASISTQPQSQTITSGQAATLTAGASGTSPFTYQWYQGTSGSTSSPVGSNSSVYTTPALTATTSYWVRVTNACGSMDSATATITVSSSCAAPSISTQPQSQTITSGQTATLTVGASGTSPFTYQWYQGTSGSTSNPVGSNSSSYATPALTATTSYWVRVTNACGSANSATATITVSSSTPSADFSTDVASANIGQQVTFTLVNVTPRDGFNSLALLLPAGLSTCDSRTGQISLCASTSECSNALPRQLAFSSPGTFNIGLVGTTAAGTQYVGPTTHSLTVNGTGSCQQRTLTLRMDPPNPAVNTPITVSFTDPLLASGETVNITWGDGGTGVISHSGCSFNGIMPFCSATHSYGAAGTYTITGEGVIGGVLYAGSVSVTVSGGGGTTCSAQPQAAFTYSPSSPATILQTIQFTDASSNSPTSWKWDFGDGLGGGAIPGGTSTARNPTYEYTTAGTFVVTLTVSKTSCSPSSTQQSVTVRDPCTKPAVPTAGFTWLVPDYASNPLRVQFTSSVSGEPDSYKWDFGDGTSPVVPSGTSTAASPTYTFPAPGSFTVKLTATNCRGSGSYQAWVTVTSCSESAVPVADFDWSPKDDIIVGGVVQHQPYAGQTVTFTDQSSNNPDQWQWHDFGGAASGPLAGRQVTVSFDNAGLYNVRLHSHNCRGWSGEKLKAVTVWPAVLPVVADFDVPSNVTTGVNAVFTARQGAAYGDPTEFTWQFDDMSTTVSGSSVNHTFTCRGSHNVTLTVARAAITNKVTKPVAVAGTTCGPEAIISVDAAKTEGLNGTSWRTDVRIFNPADVSSDVWVQVLQADTDNSSPARLGPLTLAPKSTKVLDNILDGFSRIFERQYKKGALRVTFNNDLGVPPVVISRTYTPAPGGGTYGQIAPGVPVIAGSTASPLWITGMRNSGTTEGFRTNLSLSNLRVDADTGTIGLALYDASGALVSTATRALPPLGYSQIAVRNLFTGAGLDTLGAFAIRVDVPAGVDAQAFASVVDNLTGDPVLVQGLPRVTGPIYLPSMGHNPGVGGTVWRTDLQLTNADTQPHTWRLMFFPAGGGGGMFRQMTLAPYQSASVEDAVEAIYLPSIAPDVSGMIKIEAVDSSGVMPAVQARTYNKTAYGTYGQNINPLYAAAGASATAENTRILLAGMSTEDIARTNLGFVNLSESGGTEFSIYFYDESGQMLNPEKKPATYSIGINGWDQKKLENFFKGAFGVDLPANQRAIAAEIIVTGGGPAYAYASVIDNLTGDPSFTPGVAAPAGSQTCSYSILPASRSHGAAAANDVVSVKAGAECAWTATSNAAWITVTSGATGSGNGAVAYSVAVNPAQAVRTGTLTIARQTFTVSQAGASCSYAITPATRGHEGGAATGLVTVTAGAGCSWTAASNAAWITVTSGATGSGNGAVGYSVAANPAQSVRTGTLTIAGQTFTVTQAAMTCSYSITPASRSHEAAAASDIVSVGAGAGCGWTATSNAAWITVTSGATGSGNGTVGYSVAANPAQSARTGTLTIAGKTFTVTQAAASPPIPCTLTELSTVSEGASVKAVDAATTPAGKAVVLVSGAGAAMVVDAATNSKLASIPVGTSWQMTMDAAGRIYVAADVEGLVAFSAGEMTTPPFEIGRGTTKGMTYGLAWLQRGQTMATAADTAGIEVFSIGADGRPTLAASYQTSGRAWAVDTDGSLLAVALYGGGIELWRYLGGTGLTRLAAPLSLSGHSYDVELSGGYAYVASFDGRVQVVDVSNPAAPRWVATVVPNAGSDSSLYYAYDVACRGKYLAVAAATQMGQGVVALYDISNPAAPLPVTVVTRNYPTSVEFVGSRLFAGREAFGVTAFDMPGCW